MASSSSLVVVLGGEAAETPVKQCVTVVDKKIRNLEKRKGKLDLYRQSLQNTELNKDQKDALAKYDVVLQNIEFAKELQKQFIEISVDTEKAQKKTAKREKMEKHQHELTRLQDTLRLNGILNALGNDSVREDLRQGRHSSLVLTDDHLLQLDDCYQIFFPSREVDQIEEVFSEHLNTASDHLVSYLDRQDKKVLNTTYKELHELIDRIGNCGYFDRVSRVEQETRAPEETSPKDQHHPEESVVEDVVAANGSESVDGGSDVCRTGLGSDALGDVARTVDHAASQPDLYHSTHWSHSPALMTQQPAVMATTGVVAMATAEVDGPPSGGFSDGAYYSGFAKQRPLQEIVSSLQGSYNFLQESQIDLEGHTQGHSGGSDVAYNSYANQNNSGQSLPSFNASQQQQQPILGPQAAVDPSDALHASQPQFDHGSSQGAQMFPGSTAPAGSYSVQGLHNVYGHHQMTHEPNFRQLDKAQYNFMDQPGFVLTQMNPGGDPAPPHVVGMNVVASGPPPIPLPGQTVHGQSLTGQGFGGPQQSAELTEAMAKKQFTMNPNADIFRSVYNDPSSDLPSGDQINSEIPAQSAGDGQLRTFAQTARDNLQASGANRGFGSNFGSGGPPRGSSLSRGGRGGRDLPPASEGAQSGGRGGGPSNGSRGTVPNTASNGQRGGVRGGLPRGGSGHVRGGTTRGFSRNTSQQSGHEQAMHA